MDAIYNLSLPLDTRTPVNRTWKLGSVVGNGTFGTVFQASDVSKEANASCKPKNNYVVKVDKRKIRNSLDKEFEIYNILNAKTRKFFPRMHFFGYHRSQKVLVLDRFGPSLERIRKERGKPFSLKTTLMTGIRMVECLRNLHDVGVVHRDLNLGNWLIGGLQRRSKDLVLIDFGHAKRFRDERSGKHISFVRREFFPSSTLFGPIRCRRRIQLSRRDDLESVAYILVYMLTGALPWSVLVERDDDNSRDLASYLKEVVGLDGFKNAPLSFTTFFKKVRSVAFSDRPPYVSLVKVLQDGLKEHKIKDDGIFDWSL